MTVKRQTAEQFIEALQARAKEINAGQYAYTIERLEIFGSYLRDKQLLGDLDVMVTKRPRFVDAKQQQAACDARIERAKDSGRIFSMYLLQLFWPEEEVDRALRGKNRSISIHHSDERPQLVEMGAAFQTIFEEA